MPRPHSIPSSRTPVRTGRRPAKAPHFAVDTPLLRRLPHQTGSSLWPWKKCDENAMAILESDDHGKTFHLVALTSEAERLDPAPQHPVLRKSSDRLPLLQDIDVADALTRALQTGAPTLLSDIYFNTGARSGWRNAFIFPLNRCRVGIIYEDITSDKEALRYQLQSHKLEALGTLARGICHELNNILMAISGFTDLALTRSETPRVTSYLKHIREAHDKAESLVRQLHFFSRTGQNGTEPLHTELLIGEAIKTLKPTLPENVELHVSLAPHLHHIQGDPALLHQMLMQLLRNAAQAVPKEGGRLSVTAKNIEQTGHPLLAKRSEQDWIRIEIQDTGPGMPPNILDRIFDPFFTTSPCNDRLGLGLAVVHGIVGAHDGILSSHTVPGKGCAFRVLLPGVPLQQTPSPSSDQDNDVPSRHVLIIDDQPELLLMQQEGLEGHGYRTTCCLTGEEGVRTYMQEGDSIDIILVDYAMPGMNGLEVARQIHALSPSPPPIVLCTGFLPVHIRTTLSLSHITDILYKPISIEALAARLRELPVTATKDGS